MHPSDQELQEIIVDILRGSDIVWPKYGLDTYQKLASNIVDAIKDRDFHILDSGDYHELAGTYE